MPSDSFSRQDSRLTVTRVLPSSTAAVVSPSIDLGSAGGLNALVGTVCDLVLDIPATTTATGQTMQYVIQDSADNVTFLQVNFLPSTTITGASGATAATSRSFRLGSTVRRYVRLSITPSATAGDQSAFTATLQIKT
jgi:hypothetical protein